MPHFKKILQSCGLIAGGVTLAFSSALATTYTYQTIVKPGAIQTNPDGINNSGEVVGTWVDSNYGLHPFTYQNGTITDFSFRQGSGGIQITGINNKGVICGSYKDAQGNQHGFIYTAKGRVITIDVPNSIQTSVNAINDKDEVTGTSYINGVGGAFVYSKGTITTFTPSQSSEFYVPQSINDKGSVTGYQYAAHGYTSAFTYIGGTFTVLTLPNTYYTAAFSINSRNVAAGQLANNARQEFGFTYTAKGREKIVGPKGSTNTLAFGINDLGVVTGLSTDANGNVTGYTLSHGQYSTLSFAGSTTFSGNYINRPGQVLGEYVDPNGHPQSFVATPSN